jgi:hypothetical protein
MSARRGPVEFERLSIQELVDATYHPVVVPPWVGQVINIVLICLAARFLLGQTVDFPLWGWIPCVVFAVAVALPFMSGEKAAHWVEGELGVNQRIREKLSRERGDRIAVANIRTKTWVYRAVNPKKLSVEQSHISGAQVSEEGVVEHRFVVSVSRINGNEMRVAFSTGESEVWHPRSYVYVADEPRRPIECPAAETSSVERRNAPDLLKQLTSLMYEQDDDFVPVQKLFRLLACEQTVGDGFGLAFDRAVKAGKGWKLLDADEKTGALRFTKAGLAWHEASPEFHGRASRKDVGVARSVEQRAAPRRSGGTSPVTFNISNFSGNLNYAQHDITGDSKVSQSHAGTVLDGSQVMDALRQLLQSDEIPWNHEDLREVREDLEEAAEAGDSDSTAVRRAFSRLQCVVGQLALGVAGNHVYQLLVNHFSQGR